MSLWDPEAAGNAAQYLRLGDKYMMELRSQPFDGGKALWIPYAETGYCKAELIGEGRVHNYVPRKFFLEFRFSIKTWIFDQNLDIPKISIFNKISTKILIFLKF